MSELNPRTVLYSKAKCTAISDKKNLVHKSFSCILGSIAIPKPCCGPFKICTPYWSKIYCFHHCYKALHTKKNNNNKKQQSMKIFMKQNTHKQKNKIIWKPSNWIRFSCLYHWKYWKVDYICTWPTKISVIFLMWISKAFILITPSYIWQSNSNNTQLLLLYVIHFFSFCSNTFLWSYVLFRNFNNVSIIALIQRSN